MPKSPVVVSPSAKNDKHDETLCRKRKNAEAQAAFRQRRANYIHTLEEAVNNLESVVKQLQDSCRESRSETNELRQENSRLRTEIRDRERLWRSVWPRRVSNTEDIANNNMNNSVQQHYVHEAVSYRSDDASLCHGQYNQGYQAHSASPSYASQSEGDLGRLPKIGPYFHGARDTAWTQSMSSASPSEANCQAPSHTSSNFSASPALNPSDMPFISRFPAEEQKISLTAVDTNTYNFSSRSISPASISPSASSSTVATPTFPFNFQQDLTSAPERTDYDFRRHGPHSPEVTLHGGTADVNMSSVSASMDAARYRPSKPLIPAAPLPTIDANNHHNHSFTDNSDSAPQARLIRPKRNTTPARSSRSPSPGGGHVLSSTLAVIKAQAFGALRRTRVRTKRIDTGNTGTLIGSKRGRAEDMDEDESSSPMV